MNRFIYFFSGILFCITSVFIGCSPFYHYKKHPSEIQTRIIKKYEKSSEVDTLWVSKEYSVLVDENDSIINGTDNDTIKHGRYCSYRENLSIRSVREYQFAKLMRLTDYFIDGSKEFQIINHEKDNDTTIWYSWEIVEKIKNKTNNFSDGTVEIEINGDGKDADTTIAYTWTDPFDTTTKSTIKKIEVQKNKYNYYDIHFNPDGTIKPPYKVGIIPHPNVEAFVGYPSAFSLRLGADLELPSQNDHIQVYPYYLSIAAEAGLASIKSGVGITKRIDTHYLRKTLIQLAAFYSWHEIDWKKFDHVPANNLYLGMDVKCNYGVFGFFSIKTGPYFKIYGNSDTRFFYSLEIGFDIREFKRTILAGAG